MGKIVVVDETRCVACDSCRIACAMAHAKADTLAEAIGSGEVLQARLFVEPVGSSGLPIMCHHCQDAPCMTICPKDAINRSSNDTPVLIDAEKCIGCKFCTYVCPFGVIEMSKDGSKLAVKCDLCIERTKEGKQPACIEACPTNALKLQNVSAWLAERGMDEAQLCAAADASGEVSHDESGDVKCSRCGKPVGPQKMLDTLREKLPETMAVENVCPECRRLNKAELIANTSTS